MNIYEKQLIQLKNSCHLSSVHNFISVIIIKEDSDDDIEITLKSLQYQLNQFFEFYVLDWSCGGGFDKGWMEASLVADQRKFSTLLAVIKESKGEYLLFVRAGNYCAPHMLMKFEQIASKHIYDAIYSDEAIYSNNVKCVTQTEVKEDFFYIWFFKHLYTGQSVLWRKECVLRIIPYLETTKLDTFVREMFIRIHPTGESVFHIPEILLLKWKNQRNCQEEQKLLPLLQEELGRIGIDAKATVSTSYNLYSFEINRDINFEKVSFIMIAENLERTFSLLMQLHQVCDNIRVFIGVDNAESYNSIVKYCIDNGMSDIVKIIKVFGMTYGNSILKLAELSDTEIQIILRDTIRWCNREDIERLIQCFTFQEIMAASPQIATATTKQGNPPRMIYAGASVCDASFSTELFKGREQNIYGELDPVWTNRKITLLSSHCFAVRRNVWSKIINLHSSIKNADQFAIEVSLILKQGGMLCEYSAQSSFWLGEELGNGDCLKTYDKSDCYWHWMNRYGELLENICSENHWIYRSWKTHLNECMKMYVKGMVNNSGKKRILIYTHELSLTGAPIVLAQAVEILRKNGYDLLVLSPEDGPIKKRYLDNNIPVIIDPVLYDSENWMMLAADFDLVIVNTVVPFKSVNALGKTKIPVLWWLHDSRAGYEEWLQYVLPSRIEDNIHTYAVSPYAKKVMQDYRPEYKVDIMPYGLEDFDFSDELNKEDFKFPKDRIIFTNIGQILPRKGQDILVDAIKKLEKDILEKCYFVFVGSVVDKKIFSSILEIKELYPDNIRYIERIPHEHMKDLYKQVDAVICSSRDDPLPTFITEAMICEKVCICSENTGFNGIIKDGVNGYVYKNNSGDELAQTIKKIIKDLPDMREVKAAGRSLYENILSVEAFTDKLLQIVTTCMDE